MTSIHNIRRPAFWLLLTSLAAAGFLVLTDPSVGLVSYPGMGTLDEMAVGRVGTVAGLVGTGLVFGAALSLCTRKGTPPTSGGDRSDMRKDV